MLTLPRRHGNVVTPAWQRCYGGMATLLRRHGNVVMPAWQRMMRHVASVTTYYVMAIWVIRLAFLNGKQLNLSSLCSVPCSCHNQLLPKSMTTACFFVFNHLTQSAFAVVWRYKQEMRALKVSVHLLLAWSGVLYIPLCDGRLSQCLLQLVALGGTEAVEELRHLHAALACQLQFVQVQVARGWASHFETRTVVAHECACRLGYGAFL